MQAHTKQELRAVLRAHSITPVYVARDRWGIDYPKLLDEPAVTLQVHSCRSEYCVIYQLL